MTQNIDFDLQSVYEEIVSRGYDAGVTTQEAYDELVTDTLQEFLQVGEAHDDQDLVGFAEQLRGRWSEYQAGL